MKKIYSIPLSLLLTLIFTSCQFEQSNPDKTLAIINENNKLISNQISYIEKFFKQEDQNIDTTVDWFNKYQVLIRKTDSLISSIVYESFPESLDKYIKYYQDFSAVDLEVMRSLNTEFREVPNEVLINKIRLCELEIANFFYNMYIQEYFKFDMIKPIVVPKRNPIKLGETFESEILLVGLNSKNKVMVTMNNVAQQYKDSDSLIPILKIKPTQKGNHKLSGTIEFKHSGRKQLLNWDYEYTVE